MFHSILFPSEEQVLPPSGGVFLDYVKDLYLDQIIDPILNNRKDFELESFYYSPLRDEETIMYRQRVTRDLENERTRHLIATFSKSINDVSRSMREVQKALTSKQSYENNYLTKGRLLDDADRYCIALTNVLRDMQDCPLSSEGMQNFVGFLAHYFHSEEFGELFNHVKRLREEFSKVEYCMYIKGVTVHVRKYEGQEDLSKDILRLFEKFRQGDVKDYRNQLSEEPSAHHVEAAVLDMVATWYKDIFEDLDDFCNYHVKFMDETIVRFSQEVQFYLSWWDYIHPLQQKGLPFCYPMLSPSAGHLYAQHFFDLALASKMHSNGTPVTNDFSLTDPEHIIVVTGPNQGGKTTFARAFGQVHYLAALGLCIPGSEAQLLLFDKILTHFWREEDLSTLNGKLQDDLLRLFHLLEQASAQSVIIINEIFASTTLSDAILLGNRMMDSIAKIGAPTVCVTFIDELAQHGVETVSMMSTVKQEDPTIKTYKIIRKPPDGLAYAMHLAGKHGLTYDQLCGRLQDSTQRGRLG